MRFLCEACYGSYKTKHNDNNSNTTTTTATTTTTNNNNILQLKSA